MKTLLCILDGWGDRADADANAIAMANAPNYDRLLAENPHSLLATSGEAVGLPAGQMGNSEVGHMTIGGGRVMRQNLPRINAAIADGSLRQSQQIQGIIAANRDCHLVGIVSDGGVHGHISHIISLSHMLADAGIKVHIHAITDGRDVAPNTACGFIAELEKAVSGRNVAIATVSGRYYAMDRDNRWDRVGLAYDAIISGTGEKCDIACDAVSGGDDEFILPTVIGGYSGAVAGDSLLIANFRADRAREISFALAGDSSFTGFERAGFVSFGRAVTLTHYADNLLPFVSVVLAPQAMKQSLGEVVSQAGLAQLRSSETEKYAHITFFFNGGVEEIFAGEERLLVQSPDVATYDLQPEMSAYKVTDGLVEAISKGKHDLIIVNFANTDMVGHTGNMEAAIKAVEAVDICIGRLADAVIKAGYAMLITADHGNAEQMLDDENRPHTQHTLNDVPLIAVGLRGGGSRGDLQDSGVVSASLVSGSLADIAPTILSIMDLAIPEAMTGKNLITYIKQN